MPTIDEMYADLEQADASGDYELARVIASRIKSAQAKPQPAQKLPTPAEAAFESGRRGGMAALQGPTFGFADEALAALNALGGSLGQAAAGGEFNPVDQYRNRRDQFRRETKQFEQDRPILSTATQAAASAPTMLLGAPAKVGVGLLPTIAAGAKSGALFGGIGGLGASEADTVGEMAIDTAMGAGTSAAFGSAVPVVGAGIRRMNANPTLGRSVGSFLPGAPKPTSTAGGRRYAEEKVAEAFIRDTAGKQTAENAARRAESMTRAMGPGSRAVDIGRENTMRLLDTQVQLPGKAANLASRAISERQQGIGNRIISSAARSLKAQGVNYADEMAAREAEKAAVSKPFYDQLKGVKFTVDDDLATILKRGEDYVAGAEKIAKIEGRPAVLGGVSAGSEVSLDSLNVLKGSLFDAAESAKREGNKKLAGALTSLRIALKDKIDDLSPKDEQGRSIARVADELWSGAESDRAALEMGRRAMKEDVISLADEMRGMSQSEAEAYRIGAAQSIRELAGTQAGQTKLLKQWREPGTSEKLKIIFGDEYKTFVKTLTREGKMKDMERVRGGSNTASRLANQADLDTSAVEGAVALTQAGGAGALPLLGTGARMLGKVATPEPVRDDIAQILLGDPNKIPSIIRMMQGVQEQRARTAAGAGAFSGAFFQ